MCLYLRPQRLCCHICKWTDRYPCCIVISLFMGQTSAVVCSNVKTHWTVLCCVLTVFHDLPGSILALVLSFSYLVWIDELNKKQLVWKAITQRAYQACAVSCVEDNNMWVWTETSGKMWTLWSCHLKIFTIWVCVLSPSLYNNNHKYIFICIEPAMCTSSLFTLCSCTLISIPFLFN